MSFKADFQIFLQIEDFVNIDLPSQGLFRLRASVYQERPSSQPNQNNIIWGSPFEFTGHPTKPNPNPRKIFFGPQCNATSFDTKVGSVRFSDQRIVIDDYVRFKLQVQSFPRLHSENIYLQVDLLFMPCYHSSSIKQFEGHKVASSKFRLETLEHGLLNYYEGIFGEDHTSKFSFTLFACLANFKFGKYWPKGSSQTTLKIHQQSTLSKNSKSSSQKSKQISEKQRTRSKVQTFEQFFQWIAQFYQKKIPNPNQYFYNTYVKNLRYYFYLAQTKVNEKSILGKNVVLKVPRSFLQLPNYEQMKQKQQNANSQGISQKIFKKYMSTYQPLQMTCTGLQMQINQIYMDIYQFLLEMEKQFIMKQLSMEKMKKQYHTYIKERYGERVFKSIVYGNNHAKKSDQNQRIAKKMRQKETSTSTANYPIQDLSFINQKSLLQFVFYEVCFPDQKKPQIRFSNIPPTEKQENKKICIPHINCEQKNEKKAQNIPMQEKIQSKDEINKDKQVQADQNYEQELDEKLDTGEKTDQEQNKIQQDNIKQQEHSEPSNIGYNGSYRSDMSERGYGSDDFSLPSNEEHSVHTNILDGLAQIEDNHKYDHDFPEIFYEESNMLIVLCHGFQGSQYDMLITMRNIKEMLPKANYLLSKSNEGNTEGDIEEMGQRLSKQVKGYIHHYLDAERVIINFVGHSMGGIISRSCLKHLTEFSNQFGFFCSLSSPHLGYINGVDTKVKAGLWVIKKFKPVLSLNQLSMDDSKNRRNTLIYRLSQSGSLKKFRKIILLSSYEDSYVAWHSARILKHHSEKKSQAIIVQNQMVQNILGNRPVHRIDVNFEVRQTNLDSIIGRTAHINLIVQESLFKIINATLTQLFDITKQ